MARGRANQITIDLPFVYIEWEDHHANGGWQEQVDHTPAPCASIGWLVKEDRKAITIAGSFCAEAVGNTQYILKRDITHRRKLNV